MEGYRSLVVSQILLEQHAILELLFWFLWQTFVPFSQIALSILKAGYKCDLGLRLNAPSATGTTKSSGLGAFAYLEDKDQSVLKNVEMMWMLLCVSVFDIHQLLNSPIILETPLAITGPEGTSGGPTDTATGNELYTRIYDSRLLPQLHTILSSTPQDNPRYAPILLSWAYVLYCVSLAAVDAGEALPRQYIPFLQMIIPEFSVDTIGDRTSEVGRWMSSMITSFAVGELGVLTYLDACIKGGGEDAEKRGNGVFTAEDWGQGTAFGPPIYREVVKRLLLCLPSLLQLPLLPPQHLTAYLTLFTTLFGYGPSLPELALDYWERDVVNAEQRAIFDITSDTYPLAGAGYPLNGSLENLIRLQRALTGVGTWELQGGCDLSSMSSIPSGSAGLDIEIGYGTGVLPLQEANRENARKHTSRHVFHYLDQMETFSMVLQQSGPMGFRNMWDTIVDSSSVYAGSNGGGGAGAGGMFYTNLHPFLLPGGSILPARSRGKLISGGSGKPLVVKWLHGHSGWSVLLEILDECGKRLRNSSSFANSSLPNQASLAITHGPGHMATPHVKRGGGRPVPFTLASIGVDFASLDVEGLIVEILDLFRSVIMHKDDASHVALFDSMEQSTDSMPVDPMDEDRSNELGGKKNLDLAQVVIQILSDALVRAGSKLGRFSGGPNAKAAAGQNLRLITSSVSMLSALARVLPRRVWPLMRSTGLLGLAGGGFGFGATTQQSYKGSDNGAYVQPSSIPQSTTAAVLASERATGSYDITLSVLSLVRSLLDNAIESDMSSDISPELKGEVLGNALRFVHASVWCEYTGWKYRRLGDRFEIGTRVTSIYCDVLRNWTAGAGGEGSSNGLVFRGLAAYVLDAFLFQATPNTVTPLVHTLTIGQDMSRALKSSQRNAENAKLIGLLQSYLLLSRFILAYKRSSPFASRQSLLEHLLCTGTSINSSSVVASRHHKVIPVDSIANLALSSDMGPIIPVSAVDMLSSVVLSFGEIQPSPPSLVTHMTDAEETVNQLVRIVSSNYEESRLRKAIWSLMAHSVDHQPALATLFVTGSFFVRPSANEKKDDDKKDETASASKASSNADRKTKSALTIAVETTSLWEALWKNDPALLSVIIRFIDAVFRHELEHAAAVESVRLDSSFWMRLMWIIKQRVPADFADDTDNMEVDKTEKSKFYTSVRSAYHKLAQAFAVNICAIEAGSQRRSVKPTPSPTPVAGKSKAPPPAVSLMALKNISQVGDTLSSQLKEAMKSSLDIELHERLAHQLRDFFPDFSLEALQSPFPAVQRLFGAEYLYQVTLLEPRVVPEMTDRESGAKLRQLLNDAQAVNCNWSIVDAEIEHTRAWKQFLQEGGATMQDDDKGKTELFKLSISMSETIANEHRTGKTMSIIHTERLGALLALLESTWSLSLTANKEVAKMFAQLLRNVHAIVMSEVFPPIESLRQSAVGEGTGFHRQVLRIAYFCARKARTLFHKGQIVTAEQAATVASTMLSITGLVSTALSEAIDAARVQPNIEIDRDMELLVTVFEQSTRPELHTSPRLWLERVQELNLARSSLELLTKCDIGGNLVDGETLRAYHYPLYARHMLALQLCLSSMEAPAETLALSGAISAYSNLSIASDLTVGTLNAFHPELPGERNPGQLAWCNLLAIVTALVGSAGKASSHFIETEVTSFIQLYGAQISRALEWNVGQPLSSATLEELEAVMRLFNAISLGTNPRSAADIQAKTILQTFAEKGLTLLQHINYALSHPNHFASLFEAITADERRALDKEVGQAVGMSSVYELLDADKRPFIASLTQRMHVVVRDILSTLVIVNQGDEVVIGEPEDWPTVVHIAPTTKVTVGELATMGTLLEMGNGIIDILQHIKLTDGPVKFSMVYSTPTFDSSYDVSVLSQSLESIAIFSVTQLAVWQYQITAGNSGMEDEPGMEWDDVGYGKDPTMGRVGKRAAMLPGLGGDVLNELTSMLSKAKAALAKSAGVKDPSKSLMALLEAFLNMRVMS
ncbi:hypothetical protein M408DRAFT_332895 [Serendipita vermifera MAFF 305830]|uniref:Nucleoporin Nup188 N-terminal subdomain III domain-containing protein n=1 Tax=Serendipita vermifera MAFF 305830 TaxID=933852 RepID=A0A0C2WYY0_SERVB|nr:hypothetical protein M408DRAFT_332895 [Serendipita vermifera MAFF 305830]